MGSFDMTVPDAAARLQAERAAIAGLLADVHDGISWVPSGGGAAWHSEAQRSYATRLGQLRDQLGRAWSHLDAALTVSDAAIAQLAVGDG